MVLIDPPFITMDVWEKYTDAAKLLLISSPSCDSEEGGNESSKVICSTVSENKDMMRELLGVQPLPFQPSIPHLVYQYDMYANYDVSVLCERNPEIPVYDD